MENRREDQFEVHIEKRFDEIISELETLIGSLQFAREVKAALETEKFP